VSTPPLEGLGFVYRQRKGGVVELLHRGKLASTLSAAETVAFLAEVQSCGAGEAQQVMARLTGNYKRGNERLASAHPRNRR
jgi:hypothetical protein